MTQPLTFLDPALTDTTPPCEWYTIDHAGLQPYRCDNRAAWCLHTTCSDCGQPDIQLVCDPHRVFVNGGRSLAYCPGCSRVPARFTHAEERL